MVANKAASVDQPVFMVHSGAKVVFRIRVSSGSRRGWVPLMVSGPIKLRIGFSKSDEGDALQVGVVELFLLVCSGFKAGLFRV